MKAGCRSRANHVIMAVHSESPHMNSQIKDHAHFDRGLIRLDTLIRLRWYAIIGQAGAIFLVAFGFGFPLPLVLCLTLVAISIGFNITLARRYKYSHRLSGDEALAFLAIDVVQLGLLLFLTGGLHNPFAILLMAPVIVAATSLRQNHILALGGLALAITTVLAFWHLPLPWYPERPLEIPFLYSIGVWVTITCTLAFTAIYAFRVAKEARKLADALSATELVLLREQHITALDGLAAAAAHELGTPLATIALVSKEMVHAMDQDSPIHQDAKLLRGQAERCREILQKLTSLSNEGSTIVDHQSLISLLEEEIAPQRDFGISITLTQEGDPASQPVISRMPGIHYGMGNLIENAVDFAQQSVNVHLAWDEDTITVTVQDDGPGFPPQLLHKLGEPFVSGRSSVDAPIEKGLGLGLFIARTLLERSGAEVAFGNNDSSKLKGGLGQGGAVVRVVWPIDALRNPTPN